MPKKPDQRPTKAVSAGPTPCDSLHGAHAALRFFSETRVAHLFALVFLLSVPVQAAAQTVQSGQGSPKPFPQFEAKRIKPPSPGAAKRITVQITAPPARPSAESPQTAASDDAATAGAALGRYPWFWETVPAAQDETSAALRLETALTTLANHTGDSAVAAPRLQLLQEIIEAQGSNILLSSVGTRVSPAFILAVIAVESAGRTDVVSSAGAEGLMQLMPATADRFQVTDAFDPQDNIQGGTRYLDWLLDSFANDPVLALAAYNAGEGAVTAHGGVPDYPETRDYVPKVLAAYAVARNLCQTPPQFITDGCVFRSFR